MNTETTDLIFTLIMYKVYALCDVYEITMDDAFGVQNRR